ncbi:hypothetical protein [Solidesulfovibrio alcoholivorans]|uniref:hypothetical protein n=1 Tax=Solidesulfovibrio alcoholivorans TaxID=81406 RepID=UPI000497A883|nr:hypothetical protein [Solidesulfovibrio alcoholivorans]
MAPVSRPLLRRLVREFGAQEIRRPGLHLAQPHGAQLCICELLRSAGDRLFLILRRVGRLLVENDLVRRQIPSGAFVSFVGRMQPLFALHGQFEVVACLLPAEPEIQGLAVAGHGLVVVAEHDQGIGPVVERRGAVVLAEGGGCPLEVAGAVEGGPPLHGVRENGDGPGVVLAGHGDAPLLVRREKEIPRRPTAVFCAFAGLGGHDAMFFATF